MYFKFYSTKYYITISDGKKTYTYDEGNWERISGDTFKTWWDGGKYPDYYEITVKETPNGETYHFKDPIDGGYFEFWSHMD